MPLTQPSHDLKRDLQGIASDLKWSAIELKRIAERLSQSGHEADAQAIMRMIAIFRSDNERLASMQEISREVGAGYKPGHRLQRSLTTTFSTDLMLKIY